MFCNSLSSIGRVSKCFSVSRTLKFKRCFLSPAFQCQESWQKRLQTPILKKCVLDDFYYELENKYAQSEQISAIDVDVFANTCSDANHLDEMQDLVHKLRLSKDACEILPSTHHALIRVLLDLKKYDDLMSILNDRLNYGIFPDQYTTLLLFDTFIKSRDYKNAAKTAAINMLQEDFSNQLINYYSLYSCHNYILNPTEWDKAVEPVKEEDDDEEIKVRVAYLRNPFFDDHFDLTEANDLIGKTLIMIGQEINNAIGVSYQLLGAILYKKYDLAQSYLKSIVDNKHPIHKDVFDIMVQHLENLKGIKTEEANDPNPNKKFIDDLEKILDVLKSNNLVSEALALSTVEDQIKKIVQDSESKMIAQQLVTYQEWIETRDKVLNETLDRLKKITRLAEVEKLKEELQKKEKELFFFDNEDRIDIEIEKKEEILKEGMGRPVTQATGPSSENYVPPEIVKQKGTD